MPRPGRSTPPRASRPAATGGRAPLPTAEELRNLPEYIEEGENVSLDPGDASAGGVNDEDVTIVAAAFKRFIYKTRVGDELVPMDTFDDGRPALPELRLEVQFRRDEVAGTPIITEAYKYGSFGFFGPSKDGNFPRPQPKIVAERGRAPIPRKTAQAVVFLESLKEAGLAVEELQSKGAAALVGLKVHVSRRKTDGMNERAKSLILVDSIEGVAEDLPAAVSASDSAAPSDSRAKAEEILVGILENEGGSLAQKELAKAVLGVVKDDKELRSEVLKLYRDKNFMEREDAPWSVDEGVINLS